MTITTKIDRKSDGLFEFAQSKGFWDGKVGFIFSFASVPFKLNVSIFKSEFNFAEVFSGSKNVGSKRLESGDDLLALHTASNNFKQTDMFNILRDTDSDICRSCDSDFPTQGSQVRLKIIFFQSPYNLKHINCSPAGHRDLDVAFVLYFYEIISPPVNGVFSAISVRLRTISVPLLA